VAFLTILGYSLYDTIVVFDRIRDNAKGLGATGKLSFTDVVNLSMNQTLARSINTSLVAILPILALLVLGADILGATTLQYFGLALFIGLTSGAYSSIFIASPIVAMLKELEPRYVQIRQRLETRNSAVQLLTPAMAAGGYLDDRDERTVSRRQRKGQSASQQSGPIRPRAGGRATPPLAAAPTQEAPDEYDGLDDAAPEVAVAGAGATRATAPARAGAPRPNGPRPKAGAGQANRPAPRPRKKKRR
jgi:hypothetical protein